MLTANDINIISIQLQRPTLINIVDKILSFNPNKYLSAGTHVTCFARDTSGIVIKCCQCAPETILKNENIFVEQTALLQSHNFPILPYIEYIVTDHNYIIYTQQLCKSLTELDINLIICNQILDIVNSMLISGIKISDIFYKNFGMISNKLYFYDYHNVEQFVPNGNGFLVKNLYCLFTRLGININPNKEWDNCLDIKDILSRQLAKEEENYGQFRFPRPFHKLLTSLIDNDIEKSKHYLEKCISYVNVEINKTIFNSIGNVRDEFVFPKFFQYINSILQSLLDNNKNIKTIIVNELELFNYGIIQLAFMNPNITFIIKSFSKISKHKEKYEINVKNLITKNINIVPEYILNFGDSTLFIQGNENLGCNIIKNTNSRTIYITQKPFNLHEIIKFTKMIVKIENENYLIYI